MLRRCQKKTTLDIQLKYIVLKSMQIYVFFSSRLTAIKILSIVHLN